MFKKNRNSVVNHIKPIVYYRGEPHLFTTSSLVIKDNQQIRFVTASSAKQIYTLP